MLLFSINAHGTQFEVHDSIHVNTARIDQAAPRIKLFTIARLKEILTLAAKDLPQYTTTERIAITFIVDSGRTGCLLIAYKENRVTIITALYNVKRTIDDVFKGVPHCYLEDYIFVKPTIKELRKDYFRRAALIASDNLSNTSM